ncbi:hypothetical protein DKG82_13420 [Salmonella enterica subsp. enterica serovar Lexington]|nr:hypothetical protein [Salmonella enterica subsp. enterica serovar Lexington]EAA8753630.1 hypothetical protein [Salmonella enterica subsp. enterica serovar Weltevreden]EAA9389437.1 hypothetical protein [Salmonella enterica subsp. enterica]EAB7400870.1 hypothetical protein [Salmonella enterica subsp. enterica serovar Typhimurium]EAM2794244.1 hypothetical protein [Salmonella enterica]ECE0561393.1 hypothetical protein [Salmonella enterica subsp. enterica serovar Richmond]
MTALNKQALRLTAEKAKDNFMPNFMVPTRDVLALLDELEAVERRIAELEAREVAVKQFDDFQIVHYGASEDYAKGYIDFQNNYNKALTAAGIGVKGE